MAAPCGLVQRICLIYTAEAQHAEVQQWEAEVEQQWRKEGLR